VSRRRLFFALIPPEILRPPYALPEVARGCRPERREGPAWSSTFEHLEPRHRGRLARAGEGRGNNLSFYVFPRRASCSFGMPDPDLPLEVCSSSFRCNKNQRNRWPWGRERGLQSCGLHGHFNLPRPISRDSLAPELLHFNLPQPHVGPERDPAAMIVALRDKGRRRHVAS
jgi:hypothetical protein